MTRAAYSNPLPAPAPELTTAETSAASATPWSQTTQARPAGGSTPQDRTPAVASNVLVIREAHFEQVIPETSRVTSRAPAGITAGTAAGAMRGARACSTSRAPPKASSSTAAMARPMFRGSRVMKSGPGSMSGSRAGAQHTARRPSVRLGRPLRSRAPAQRHDERHREQERDAEED